MAVNSLKWGGGISREYVQIENRGFSINFNMVYTKYVEVWIRLDTQQICANIFCSSLNDVVKKQNILTSSTSTRDRRASL